MRMFRVQRHRSMLAFGAILVISGSWVLGGQPAQAETTPRSAPGANPILLGNAAAPIANPIVLEKAAAPGANTIGFQKAAAPGANPIGVKKAAAPGVNPIVIENSRPGSGGWSIPAPGYRVATDAGGQIKGYASDASVNLGGRLDFMVSVTPAQPYRIAIYRLGWYRGAGGRLMLLTPYLSGIPQAACPMDASTGLTRCTWRVSYRLNVPRTWVSGVYVAVLSSLRRFQNYVPFTVRDDAGRQPLLVVQPVATYQAYNDYPRGRGKSLYDFNSAGLRTISGGFRAVKVSFDRPYAADGSGDLFIYDYPLVRWLEANGYWASYATDLDVHARGIPARRYRAVVIAGHSEYWSRSMRNAAEAARNAGVSLAFLGANDAYWQTRFEPPGGRADRTMVCYRSAALDPVRDRTQATVKWRDAPVARPEQLLLGVEYSDMVAGASPFVVVNARSWVYMGTGLREGQRIPRLIAGEADRRYAGVPLPRAVSRMLLGSSPFRPRGWAGTGVSQASLYVAPGGAMVFAAGTLNWDLALGRYGSIDPRVQRITHNILNRFLGLPL